MENEGFPKQFNILRAHHFTLLLEIDHRLIWIYSKSYSKQSHSLTLYMVYLIKFIYQMSKTFEGKNMQALMRSQMSVATH